MAASHAIDIKAYHADNGRFAEKGFRDSVSEANQKITFCGVNAHHQNGLIEKYHQDIAREARKLLLHAKRFWPEAIGTILWPFAIKAAEDRRNHLHLDDKGKTPIQKWSNVYHDINISTWHTFGCPVYVLENAAADGMTPKWNPRARVGIYLGHSPCHAGSVALVLNPRTLHVSPQYHVVFDDTFSTVPFLRAGEVPPHWKDLVANSSESVTNEKFELANIWAAEDNEDTPDDKEDISLSISRSFDPISQDEVRGSQPPEGDNPSSSSNVEASEGDKSPPDSPLFMPEMPDLDAITLRRSSRVRRPSRKALGLVTMALTFFTHIRAVSLTTAAPLFGHPKSHFERAMAHMSLANQHFDGTLNFLHPAAFLVNADNDTYSLSQMLKQEDKKSFIEAMLTEVQDHESREHWKLIPRSSMPSRSKTIMAIWSFKRKRFPDGRVLKHKARLCAHGGMQKWGVDYWETYSPVVNWISVRTLFAISQIHGLESKSIDFVLAFPQADLDTDVFMELPFGFDVDGAKGYVLHLQKSLYGLKNSGRNWFQMLAKGLADREFVASQVDPCIFYREDAIILVYVDDCIIFSKSNKINDSIVASLQNGVENFNLTDEGDVSRYLGVDILHHPDGRMEMRQPYLIERCLAAMEVVMGMNTKRVPATKPLLHKDADGVDRKHSWHYRQVIGMLNYLQGSTRPDIAMATHQCARFSNDPKALHERGVRHIGKYLLATKERGLIFKPDSTKGIECFVDADFAGSWAKADSSNPENVMSRTGYVIYYAGCPVLWASKLQTEIALSTAEAEYIALSSAMRDVIPLMQLLTEISVILPIYNPDPKVKCKVFEDNESCIAMAKAHKFTPRTKHISIKYHHFRSYVDRGAISIEHISTTEQIADIFTKPLTEQPFTYLRNKLCGW